MLLLAVGQAFVLCYPMLYLSVHSLLYFEVHLGSLLLVVEDRLVHGLVFFLYDLNAGLELID